MAAAGCRHRRRYRPPSNYARIIKVESHREHWRAVHSNCSLGIYTCGTPPALLEAPTPFRPSAVFSLSLSFFQSCRSQLLIQHLPRTSLAVSLPFTLRKQWSELPSLTHPLCVRRRGPSGLRQAAFWELTSSHTIFFCDHLSHCCSLYAFTFLSNFESWKLTYLDFFSNFSLS